MALIKYTDNAQSTLAGDINDTVTALSVASAPDGALFPAITGTTDYFYVTLIDTSNNREIVKVTDRVGALFTIERNADGKGARSFTTGDRVELRVTSLGLQDFLQAGINVDPINTSGSAGSNRYFNAYTDELLRWSFGADDGAESGSDAGSDFEVVRYDDAGAEVDSPLTINRATGAATFSGASATFDVLPTDGTNQFDAFPSGTRLMFQQSVAPTGWTLINTAGYHDSVPRIITSGTAGIGGEDTFTAMFGTDLTITEAQMPQHSHTGSSLNVSTSGNHTHSYSRPNTGSDTGGTGTNKPISVSTANTGSDGAHTHSISGSTGTRGSSSAIPFQLTYVDFIVAEKD